MPRKTNLGFFEDVLGGRTMANRRERLKFADKAVGQHKTAESLEHQREMKREYNQALARRVGSIGAAVGAPAYLGYRQGQKRGYGGGYQ